MAEFNVQENFGKLHEAVTALREEQKKGSDASKDVLAKIHADVADKDAKNQAFIAAREAKEKALKGQLDAIEAKLNRRDFGTGSGASDREQQALERKEAFVAYCRFGNPNSDRDAERIEQKWARVREEKGLKLEAKALSVSDDTAGGYLAPTDYVKEIIKAVVLISPSRDLVKVRQTSSKSVSLPKRTGAAAAVWVAENATRSESTNPTYGLLECPVHEITAEVYVTFADLEDSAFDLEAELSAEFAEQFAKSEGAAVINGNGVGKPFGINDAGQAVPTTASGGTTTIQDASGQANGIIKCFHAVKSDYAKNGRWGLNRTTLGSVRSLQDSQKRYLWEPSPAVGMPSMILGAPYTELPDMDNEGANKFPMAFGDWKRAYTLVDRLSISVLRDPYTKAGSGQVKFLARRRVGGQVVLAEALNLLKCA